VIVARKTAAFRLRPSERTLLLVLGDLGAAVAALLVALRLWGALDYLGPSLDFVRDRAPWFVFLPLPWVILMVNLYELRKAESARETVRGISGAAIVGLISYLLIYFNFEGSLPRRGILYYLILASLLTLLWRLLYIRVFTAPTFQRRVLVVGAGESGRTLLRATAERPKPPFHVVGLLDDDPAKLGTEVEGFRVIGAGGELAGLIEGESISDIIVAILGPVKGTTFQALLDAQQRGVEIIRMPVAYEEITGRVPIRHLEADWLLRSFVDELRVSSLYLVLKRLIDIASALVGLSTLLLLLPWAAAAILLESGKPVTIGQTRMGLGGRIFGVRKLRTMRQDAEADGTARWLATRDPRITRVGALLRRTHLDEFPQFWSVLRGDMSLIGPRPERPELVAELEKQIPFYRARLLVKPGISGWAQVNYGKGASIEGSGMKLEYDLYYIKHRTLLLDLWIIARTIGASLGLRGE
jgi:exopolysaccharide biosynthesis polyprenyl glycosylphosphotransferase